MGRMPKKGVDYFPHDVGASLSPTLYTIQGNFGNDGYAFWFKMLEHLGTKEKLYIDCNNSSDWQYFLAKARVSEELAINILDKLAEMNAIDKELWSQKVIWSENFAERLSDVFRKRGTEKPHKPDFCDRNNGTTDIPAAESTQSKVKKSKEKAADKIEFAEFVRMTQSEYDKLIDKYGKAAVDKFVDVLDNYKGANKKKYDSDYRAILSWVVDKVQREHPALFRNKEPIEGNPFEEYV